ncbi:hypothetical protein [Maribacter sp. ACAM166]|nr:hypothetical protein [Maribacter sp. ACAM166]
MHENSWRGLNQEIAHSNNKEYATGAVSRDYSILINATGANQQYTQE